MKEREKGEEEGKECWVESRGACRDSCLSAGLMTDKARLTANYRCGRGEIFMKTLLSHSEISQNSPRHDLRDGVDADEGEGEKGGREVA